MAKKKKKQKQKKGGKKSGAPAKNYVENDETLDDYFIEEDYGKKATKAKKLTGFEDYELTQKKLKAVERMQQSSESDSEEVTQTSGRMSAAQRKKVKKMQQKQKAKEDAEKKARVEAEKKAEEQRLARLAKKPKRQTRDVKKYDSQGSYFTEESFYEGETDSEGIKRTYKKSKRDVRKVDSEGSYYTEESYYETDEEIEVAPKVPEKIRKRVRKKREVVKYDSEGSYVTDESYSAFESEEEAPEPKNETKNKVEDWDSDESEEKKPVAKKKAVRNRKKAPVNKKDPTKKSRPTMSDDSDSDEPAVVRKPQKTEQKTQKLSMFDGFLSESEEEESYEEPEPEPEPEKEPTPEPVKTKKQPSWKNKKKNKKGQKKKIEEEFDLDWLNDDSPSKKKGGKKKQINNKKKNNNKKEETEDLSWIDGDGSKKAEQPESTEQNEGGLSKAALKRKRRKERLKREAEEMKNESSQPDKKPAARKLTKKQQLRLDKLEKKEAERKRQKEEQERKAEEERKKEEEERLEEERIEQEYQAEKDRIRKEKNERRKAKKKANKGGARKKAPPVSGAAAERIAMRKKIAEEKKLAKLELKRQKKEKAQKENEERERKKQELEDAKRKKEEAEKQKKLEEEKQREEAEKLRKEEKERSKRITEEVRKKSRTVKATEKDDSEDDDGGWDEEDESDNWDDDNKKETGEWDKNETENDPYADEEEEEVGDDEGMWEDSCSEEVQPEPEPQPVVKTNSMNDQWSESEDDEPQNYTEEKPVAKPVAEPIPDLDSEPEDKPVAKKKKKTWTCADCLQENEKKFKKCTSCNARKPKKEVDMFNLRAPIGVIMGNVDSGKTSLLDYIRRTKVQSGEAGGITQQIGCTNLPMDLIKKQCGEQLISEFLEDIHLPGLLIIDTPGHAAFGNMRERGSTMCDIAILVINMFDGIIGTADACIKMLKENDAPFIVAFNQIDKLYEWEPKPHLSIHESLESQNMTARNDFDRNFKKVVIDFANLGLNAELFWESRDVAKGRMKKENVVLVPTSARSGCGIPDMLLLWIKQCQTRKLAKKLQLTPNLNCTILEVKKVHGQGYCLDVLISDGCLLAGQTIAVCSLRDNGIVTRIKQLQTPSEVQDLRVERAKYDNQSKCQASMACRLVCDQNMEHAVAGSKIYLVQNPKDAEEVEDARDEVQAGLVALKNMEKSDIGVMVIASTLGSLEALTKFLKDKAKVPMCGWSLGTIHKKEVMRASVMLEHKPEYAIILAFNVSISPDAQEYADKEGVQIFSEEIIYQLEERFLDHLELAKERAREAVKGDVVFPCVLSIIEDKIFNRKDPIVFGCHIDRCDLRVGTPLCAVVEKKEGFKAIKIGIVESIEVDNKEVEIGENDTDVCVKVALTPDMPSTIEYKRHFDFKNKIYSMISRRSLDAIKKHYGRDLKREQLVLLRELKKKFKIT